MDSQCESSTIRVLQQRPVQAKAAHACHDTPTLVAQDAGKLLFAVSMGSGGLDDLWIIKDYQK
jgi:hypothetical protein